MIRWADVWIQWIGLKEKLREDGKHLYSDGEDDGFRLDLSLQPMQWTG